MAKLNGRVDAAPDRESTLQILTQFFGAGGANSGTNGTVVNNNNITINEHYDAPSPSSDGNQVDASLLRAATTLETSVGALAQLLGNDQGAKDLLDGYRTAIRELRQGEDWHYSRQRGEAKSQREVDTLIESLQNPAKFMERMNDRWDAMTSMGQRGGFTVGQSMRDKFLQSSSAYTAITDNPLKQAYAALDLLTRMGNMDRDVANAISANGFKTEASQLRRGLTPDEIAANKSAQRAAEKATQETAEAAKAQAKATEEQTKATQQQTRAITEQKDNTGKSATTKDPETKAKSDRADKESRKANKAAQDNMEQTAELTKEVSKSNKATERARKGSKEQTTGDNGPATFTVGVGGSGGAGGGGSSGRGGYSLIPQNGQAAKYYKDLQELYADMEERGLAEMRNRVKEDIEKQLGKDALDSEPRAIKGIFGLDDEGNTALAGVSISAQSKRYGSLAMSSLRYGFAHNEETGDSMQSSVSSSANTAKIQAEQQQLEKDIAKTEQRIQTLLAKDIVKEQTKSGEAGDLYKSLMTTIGDRGGFSLATHGFQLNPKLSRSELQSLNEQLDGFDGNIKNLNDRMRQDFSNRGIDDITNKANARRKDMDAYLVGFGKHGIELKDIDAVTKSGTRVGELWKQFNEASEAFDKSQGKAEDRVAAFNTMTDAAKQMAAALKVENAVQRLDKPAAQAMQGAEKALALPNAEAATKQYEALGQALDKLKEADTPAKTKNATDQVHAATKELQAAVKQIDTLDKKMAGADKWMQSQREKVSDAGMKIGDVKSLKELSQINAAYKQAQSLEKKQEWAQKWEENQPRAAQDTRQALKQQKTRTQMAKQDVAIEEQMTRARQVLASAGLDKNSAVAKDLQNALNGMELVKNWQNFEKRGQTMGNLKDKIKAAEKSVDEIAKFDAKSGLYKLQKDAQAEQFARLDSRNGGQQNWTAEQQDKYAQLAAQQEKLQTAFNAKDTEGFRIALQESTLLFKQLNASLKESEQATDKANKAKEQADKLQADGDYAKVSADLKQKMTDAAQAFKTVADANTLSKYQAAVKDVEDQMKTIGQERWKAGREQELASHAMAYEKLGLTYGSQALSPYQQELNQKIQTAMTSMMQGIDSVNKTATSDADKALSDGIRDLTASLKETTKLNADIKKTQEADLYGRLGQGTKEELTNAQAMLDGARSADEYAEAIERVHKAVNTANKEMDGLADDNYWDEQSKKVDIYAAKLDRMRTKNGGYDNWNQTQKDAFDGAQAQLGAMRQAVTDRSVTDLSHAQRMGNGSLSELNQRLMGTGKMIGGMGTGIDALTQKMINMASPMMVWRKMSQLIRKAGENVKAIDTQMADLKKVTDNTTGEYQQFLRTTGETAIAIGAPISDLIQTTSTFAHMGYDLATSQQLGTVATKFGNTGNFANVNDAAETIIAVVNGFDGLGITDAGAVGDKLSAVAAKYAVTADDIATGLRNSASALNVAGNNVDQSTAMITAIAETTRDAGAAGSALKVLSMRIRGAKSE